MKKISLITVFMLYGATVALGQSGVISLKEVPGGMQSPTAEAATQLRYGVAGCGGGDASSTNYGVRGTVGQPAIGNTNSTSFGSDIGYWYGLRGTASGAADDPDFPQDYSLAQNYPNPFNPTTTIQFALPERSRVTLRIYDVTGNLVQTLVDRQMPAGVHREEWDAIGVASGVYFYRIDARGFVQTKKLVLLK